MREKLDPLNGSPQISLCMRKLLKKIRLCTPSMSVLPQTTCFPDRVREFKLLPYYTALMSSVLKHQRIKWLIIRIFITL